VLKCNPSIECKKGGRLDYFGKGQGGSDLGFVAFIILITAIAVVLVLIQIYLQNPR
jgi:hypothetical protein